MRRSQISSGIFSFTISAIVIALVVFGILQSLKMPAGTFLDWLIGIGTFAWLMTIVVIPWDVYFEASEVLHEGKESQQKNIAVDNTQLAYVKGLKRYSLIAAIVLHIASAGGLYWLALSGVSVVGYYGAGAAILLTFFRPAIRAYEYISTRLTIIREQIKYPREDVNKLKDDLNTLVADIRFIKEMLLRDKPESWINIVEGRHRNQKGQIDALDQELRALKDKNQEQFEKIGRETRQMFERIREDNLREYSKITEEHQHNLAKLSRDGKFVDNFIENLAEIVRFIKKA